MLPINAFKHYFRIACHTMSEKKEKNKKYAKLY